MTTRTFTPWVGPIAAELRETRNEVMRVARQLLPEQWSHPSPLEGWTYKDLLAHLATGDWVCQTVLTAVTTRTPLDPQVTDLDFVNEGNAQRIEERKEASVDELIAELEREGEKTETLLAQLTNVHEPLKGDAPMSLGDYLRGFPGHNQQHLHELKTALDQVML
jgi:uncharacterized protein (TIGR03083 family)